jgi:3-dehydroquinate dehydratase type I
MICVSIGEWDSNSIVKLNDFPFIEIRFDLLQWEGEEVFLELGALNVSWIATCREGVYNDQKRFQILLNAIQTGAAYIDLEIEMPEQYRKLLINKAKELGCKVILSYHNYQMMPDEQTIYRVLKHLESDAVDIVKIAVMCNTNKDSESILSYNNENGNVVAFGMGEIAKESRLDCLAKGAPFTYASIDSSNGTAPGQYSYLEMKGLINER